jgi:hypothetical protein
VDVEERISAGDKCCSERRKEKLDGFMGREEEIEKIESRDR